MGDKYDGSTPVQIFVDRVQRAVQRMRANFYEFSDSDLASFIKGSLVTAQLDVWASGNDTLRDPASSAALLEELSRVLQPRTDLADLACQKALHQPADTAVGQFDELTGIHKRYRVPQPSGEGVHGMIRCFPAQMQMRLPLLLTQLDEVATVCASERAAAIRRVLTTLYEELARPVSGAAWVDVLAAISAVDGLLHTALVQQSLTAAAAAAAGSSSSSCKQQQQQQAMPSLLGVGAIGRVLSAGLAFNVLQGPAAAATAAASGSGGSSSGSSGWFEQAPYKAAAKGRVVQFTQASMMTVKVGLYSNGSVKRTVQAHLDYGCNGSCISTEFLQQNWHQVFAPGSKAELAELETPLQLGMFAGDQHTVITHVVCGVELVIGDGVYVVDKLVVPGANFSLVLGNDFAFNFAARTWARDFRDRQAGRYLILPLTASLCRPGVEAPRRPASATEFWYPMQRVPVFY
ncbi:hypothetical protein OEZ85_005114 [Tetradesmus obliquus]|uniref:Peptidase A1 domain-containing protein n=1 Tax=Tetradesmus obliquus TaxID=3088 RepID=A0ABY8UKI8_TETOB|nr:hypothetical protein OEZ85_005114 [Tetradesmus obliquus]